MFPKHCLLPPFSLLVFLLSVLVVDVLPVLAVRILLVIEWFVHCRLILDGCVLSRLIFSPNREGPFYLYPPSPPLPLPSPPLPPPPPPIIYLNNCAVNVSTSPSPSSTRLLLLKRFSFLCYFLKRNLIPLTYLIHLKFRGRI
jgi:hypothetical protein